MQYQYLNGFSSSNEHFNITITRQSQLMDSTVPMQIIINGYQAGLLKNGQTATYNIQGSDAELQALLAMNKTTLLHISADNTRERNFLVKSNMTNAIFIIGAIMVIISTILVLYTEQLIYMLIAAPPALYHLYLRFILKDKYLVIKENTSPANNSHHS